MKRNLKIIIASLLISGCSGQFLEVQPNSDILTPKTEGDFQRLLDNFDKIGVSSALPQLAADEYYLVSESEWLSSRTAVEQSSYVWAEDVYGGEVEIKDWNAPYETVFYVNNILSQIDLTYSRQSMSKLLSDIYGQALFFRAKANYDLLKNYSVPFDKNTQEADLGIPLRTDPSIDYVSQRSTVKECYDKIFEDIFASLSFLQFNGPIPERNRPTKLAAFALLSRIHLYRREYTESEQFADSALNIYDKLIDYNSISTDTNNPFSLINDELIMYGKTAGYNNSSQLNLKGIVYADSSLIKMYDENDLRLAIYFKEFSEGKYILKRGYNGTGLTPFNGLAVDEILLNKIECQVREGNLKSASVLMNRLLQNRYLIGHHNAIEFLNQEAALRFVLNERRKELVWRCLRWDDIKRLNKEGAGIVLRRILGTKEYVLEPNSSRYVFNIPQDEINRSGIQQNQR